MVGGWPAGPAGRAIRWLRRGADLVARAAWDRRDDEGAKAFAAFEEYRDAGPLRTLAAVATALAKSSALIGRWCSRYDWHARAAVFDARISAKVAARSIEDHAAIRIRQAREARRWQELALRSLDAPLDPDAKPMHPATAARIWEMATKGERDAAGIAAKTEVQEDVRIVFGYDDRAELPVVEPEEPTDDDD